MPGRINSTLGFIERELLKASSVGAIANALVVRLDVVEHRRRFTPLEGPPLSGRPVAMCAQCCTDDAVSGVDHKVDDLTRRLMSLCFASLGKIPGEPTRSPRVSPLNFLFKSVLKSDGRSLKWNMH